jgi:hypothetical protein
MAGKGGRPPVVRQRILAVLLAHHRAAGWESPLARGELLARLHGWDYGRRNGSRTDAAGDEVLVFYTGVDRAKVSDHAYQSAQAALSQALLALFMLGLIRASSAWQPRLRSAEDYVADLEADLADPPAAFARHLACGELLRNQARTLDEFIAKRRAALAVWRSGRRLRRFPIQAMVLTPAGRAQAEPQRFS